MSRFNNPQAAAAARAQAGAHAPAEHDPHQGWGAPNTAGRPAARPAQQAAALSGYTRPDPYAQQPTGYGPPPGGFGQADIANNDPFAALRAADASQQLRNDGYAYPQQAPVASDPYANGHYAARPAQPYVQPYDPYAAPSAAAQPQGFGGAGSYFPPAPDAGYAAQNDPRTGGFSPSGFDSWSATQPHQDASAFGAANGLGSSLSHGYDAGYQTAAPRTASSAGANQWNGHDPYAQHAHEPGFDGTAYAQGAQPQGASGFDQTYAEDEANYDDAPPRRSWKKIGVLLASTIVLGGGLAYAYSALMGPSSGDAPPVVKGAEGPFKVKPSDPGGKQFAHADSKIMGRLGEGGVPVSSGNDIDASGARKVPVLVVGRDGTIQPPSPPPPEPEQASETVSVPGLTLIDGNGGPPRPNVVPSSATVPAKPVTVSASVQKPLVVSPPAAPVKPKVIASAEPSSLNDSSSDAPPVAVAPAQKKTAVKKAPIVAAAVTETAATGPQPTGVGYVAVLASVPASSKSRIEALKQFADMQQKYGAILQNKTPDVQEANLGEKGTYHRLLVGPPGSRDSASELCSQLKGQGYSDCWVTAY